ncbi:MAG: hypothetical protein U0W40_12890 [Acidimicrobiia bacterium]
MDQHAALQHAPLWRTAVWTLRAAYLALVTVIVGIFVSVSGGGSAVLAVGIGLWLVTAITTAVCFTRARAQLAEPRPGFVAIRSMLLHDSIPPKPSA